MLTFSEANSLVKRYCAFMSSIQFLYHLLHMFIIFKIFCSHTQYMTLCNPTYLIRILGTVTQYAIITKQTQSTSATNLLSTITTISNSIHLILLLLFSYRKYYQSNRQPSKACISTPLSILITRENTCYT